MKQREIKHVAGDRLDPVTAQLVDAFASRQGTNWLTAIAQGGEM